MSRWNKNSKKYYSNYYDGYTDRHIKKLNKVFDLENETMKLPVPKNKKIIDYRDGYFKDLVLKWGNRKKLSPEVLQN